MPKGNDYFLFCEKKFFFLLCILPFLPSVGHSKADEEQSATAQGSAILVIGLSMTSRQVQEAARSAVLIAVGRTVIVFIADSAALEKAATPLGGGTESQT